MNDYAPPTLAVYGDVAAITAAVLQLETQDTFFDVNGTPQPGNGSSIDLCAVPDGEPEEC